MSGSRKSKKPEGWTGEPMRHALAQQGVETTPPHFGQVFAGAGKRMTARGYQDAIHAEEYRGHTINIVPDHDPVNVREEWDNLGVMVYAHKKYTLGDVDADTLGDFDSWDEVREHLETEEKALAILPLYLYDHSGITMSTGPFSCPWDSGQVGFIYVNKEQLKKMGLDENTPTEQLREMLEGEVQTYDDYITGNVYGFVVTDKDGEEIDDGSVWGFYGDYEKSGILEDAKATIDAQIESTTPP